MVWLIRRLSVYSTYNGTTHHVHNGTTYLDGQLNCDFRYAMLMGIEDEEKDSADATIKLAIDNIRVTE